jgi:hypothetical protein
MISRTVRPLARPLGAFVAQKGPPDLFVGCAAAPHPLIVLRNGIATSFAYGPDGERVSKTGNSATTWYLGNDSEYTPVTGVTSYLHPDVRREGSATDFLLKDHLSSNRVTLRMGGLTTPQSYGPYGNPKNQSLQGKGYINERCSLSSRRRGTPRPACNTSTPATMTRTSHGSSRRTPGTRSSQAWMSTAMPMPTMIPSI